MWLLVVNSQFSDMFTCDHFIHSTFIKHKAYDTLYVNVISQKGLREEQEILPKIWRHTHCCFDFFFQGQEPFTLSFIMHILLGMPGPVNLSYG